MAVKITQPARNLREELNELRTPTGIAGEAMMRADTPQEQFNLIGAGRKNLIINGAMNVWQRGTSTTAYSSSVKGYIADRFAGRYLSLMERSSDVPTGQPFYYSLHCTTVSGSDPWIIQHIENVKELRGQTVTLSYWVKSPDGGSMRSNYFQNVQNTPQLNGSEWTYVTDTFVVPQTADDNEAVFIQFEANKVANYYITGVQLELGKVATPFEHRSYGEELALCQRYYEVMSNLIGTGGNTTTVSFPVRFKVSKRATPTVVIPNLLTINDTNGDMNPSANNITVQTSDANGLRFVNNGYTGLNQFRPYYTNIDTVIFDAEL